MILFFRLLTSQPQLVHDTLDTFMIYWKASIQKFLVYSPYTVSSFVFIEDSGDFCGYIRISFLHLICLSNLIIIC